MSREQRPAPSVVHLASAIASVHRLVDATARAHSVTVNVEPVCDDIRVYADEAELQNVLINVLLNGIQACNGGGKVTVSARVDESIHVLIRDNGCGIAADDSKRIFEPFFSLRSGGTGLGLFLSLNYVRGCGGDILVESCVGEGSTFELVLPTVRSAVGQGVPA
jgi:signal transduction histidine kinase